ncbi:unnamed protein product [Arctia plantaginis]|uniref:Uncharacterized protein n=1 Tax=Arctia plantaginis TaxID=874455 RepID=A0A8S1A4B1_ARCPL|nr:unnamed protein product [Arctia plantaginis]
MSSSDSEGGRLPLLRQRDPFRPRGSFRRTPPGERRANPGLTGTAPPDTLERAQAAFDAVIAGTAPGIPTRECGAQVSPPAPTERQRPAAAKRILSPDEQAEADPKRRSARDLSMVCGSSKLLAPPTPATEYGSPFSSGDDGFLLGDEELGKASARQLLAKAGAACRGIEAVAGGQASRLNKADLAAINAQLRILMEIVGHCCITVEGQKTAVTEMQRQHNILDEVRAREAARASRAEAEAERPRSEAAATGAAGGSVNEGWQTVNYARGER